MQISFTLARIEVVRMLPEMVGGSCPYVASLPLLVVLVHAEFSFSFMFVMLVDSTHVTLYIKNFLSFNIEGQYCPLLSPYSYLHLYLCQVVLHKPSTYPGFFQLTWQQVRVICIV